MASLSIDSATQQVQVIFPLSIEIDNRTVIVYALNTGTIKRTIQGLQTDTGGKD